MEDSFAPPRALKRLGEVRVVREPLRLLGRAPSLLRDSASNRRLVMVVPGLGSSDRSGAPLRAYLRRLGHQTLRWELGVNGRDLRVTLPLFEERLENLVAEMGAKTALVGWSLGGVVARETARDRPDLVSMVITYGAPTRGPRYTAAAGVYSEEELELIDGFIQEREQCPIAVPVTSIYSKNDGVVDWRTSLDDATPGAENIEVTSTHVGMGIDPDVWRIVAERLDRHAGGL